MGGVGYKDFRKPGDRFQGSGFLDYGEARRWKRPTYRPNQAGREDARAANLTSRLAFDDGRLTGQKS